MQNPTTRRTRRAALSLLLLALGGCGAPEGDEGVAGSRRASSSTTFAGVVALCPATTSWGAWSQTPVSTWDSDTRPVVEWIKNRTGISCSTYSGHDPSIGRAADWRPHSRDEGTQLANWFLANTKSGGTPLGIDYIIWQAQIYLPSSGVKPLADRGSITQNHCDHVHISFVSSGSVHFDASQTTPWGDTAAPEAGLLPDAKPRPAATDGGSPETGARADAGVSSSTTSDDTAGAPLTASPSPESDSTSVLTGGCRFVPEERDGQPGGLWLVVLLGLGAALRGRRRPGQP